MKKIIIKLWVSLFLITNSYADTTNNLVSQNFTTGWSGTNITSLHGTAYVAGVNGQYVESDPVSLNSIDINKESLNEGFTVTGSSNYYFWSGLNQSVTQTIKTVDDNGNILTQTRVISGTSGSGTTLDQLVVGQNSQQDYEVSLRYDFYESSLSPYHRAADIIYPSLYVDYTYVPETPPLDTTTQTALLDLNTEITKDLQEVKTVKIESETIDNTAMPTSEEPQLETQSDSLSSSTPSTSQSSPAQESAASDQTAPQESQTQEQASGDSNDEKQESQGSEEKSEVASTQDDKSSKSSNTVSLSNSIENIDVEVKDPAQNMEMKNNALLNEMVDNSALGTYANIPFYKYEAIYEDQIDIRDNRVLYANTSLISYMEKDPVFTKQNLLYNIKIQKQKLLNEIEVLKNG